MWPFEIGGRIEEEILDFIKNKRKLAKESKNYLTACIEQSRHLGQDWVAKSNYLLDTQRAFVLPNLADNDGRSESMASALSRHKRLVIQGQTGVGKSTLVRYITLLMAKTALNPKQTGNLPRQCLNLPLLFPIRVELADCQNGLSVDRAMLTAIPNIKEEYVQHQLDQGQMLVLFDGLDEVVDAKRRSEVMHEIARLTHRFGPDEKGNRFLVTTRTASYNHRALAGAAYELYTLQELTADQQEDMVRRYYELWAEQNPQGGALAGWELSANELIDQLSRNPGLARLRNNPLHLSQIALLHFQGKPLPAQRHELYKICIRNLVTRRKGEDQLPDEQIEKRVTLAGELALAMHQNRGCESFPCAIIEEILAAVLKRRPELDEPEAQPADLVDRLEQGWGLLTNMTGKSGAQARYSFSNLSFQEYLAAYLIHRYPDDYWPILKTNLQDDWWQEVVFVYTAMPQQPDRPSPLDQVVGELTSSEIPDSITLWIRVARCLANESGMEKHSQWHDVAVSRLIKQSFVENEEQVKILEALCQIEPDGREFALERILGRRYGPLDQQKVMGVLRRMSDPAARQHMRDALLAELKERPRVSDRILLAEALGQIGDPRLGQMIALSHAAGRRGVKAHKIGKYPVTNVEYARFVEAKGYPPPSDWVGKAYPLKLANHPVVYVSLDNAMDYCTWLSQKTGKAYRLPTVAEWMTAAEEDEVGRRFPWGNRLDLLYFNGRTNIGSTTPVGIYVEGETERSVADLLGNVWEWTLDQEGKQSVLKGGAFDTIDLGEKGLHARMLELPSAYGENIGFRVVMEEK